jgi:hypothetical protein
MLNFKQNELGHQLFEKLVQQFPQEVEFVDITESTINPNNTWVNIVTGANEDKWIDIRETASEMSMDILLEYGHHITINPLTTAERLAATT